MKSVKRIASIIALGTILTIGYALPVWASCTTHTYTINGRFVTCQTCCYFGNQCHTTCF